MFGLSLMMSVMTSLKMVSVCDLPSVEMTDTFVVCDFMLLFRFIMAPHLSHSAIMSSSILISDLH